jgi:nitrite reductase/ring-hydroxylating ferredoxin subunit
MCQCHGSQFDIVTGAVLRGPATKALGTYEARERDGTVQVGI